MAAIAAVASSRATKNSDWISSPELGMKPERKWGKRSDQDRRPGLISAIYAQLHGV